MKLTIIGASGHGRVAGDIAKAIGYSEIEFLDDREGLTVCGEWPVRGGTALAAGATDDLFVAIGNPAVRRRLMEQYADRRIVSLIHPAAVIGTGATVGRGSIVMAGAVINPYAAIGQGCIVNTCASVDHDCVVEDYVHVAVGAHLCGAVTVGVGTWIGAGATVIQEVRICEGCMIGAGSTVIRDITQPGTYVGVPVKQIERG